MSCEYVAAVRAERFSCDCCGSGGKSGKFQWVAHPDSGTGTRPKRHSFLQFPFLAVMLFPGQQRTDSFLSSSFLGPPPTSSFSGVVAGSGIEQRTGYPENVDHEVGWCFCGGAPPAVTTNAVSGWGQFRLEYP